jgi:hypothetical protein
MLQARFPDATPDQLSDARGYAYGGCVIQDLGYYPFGSRFFSNLLHYVRTGDFIDTLIRDAQDVNEYAFALGALGHYSADNEGHPLAVNLAVALMYPKLKARFGDVVTYEQSPKSHVMAEFAFDVVQVAAAAYAPEAYHSFIGFRVAKPLLERAFSETYGIEMKEISDKEMLRILQEQTQAGVEIKVIGSVAGRAQFDVQKLAGPRLHTRTIIRDRRQAFVGSQSLRGAELDSRRELGLIVQDGKALKMLIDTFESDWAGTRAKKGPPRSKRPEASGKEIERAVQVFTKELDPLTLSVKKAVRRAVAKAGEDVLRDKDVKETLKKVVKKAVKEAVKKAVEDAQKAAVS